MIPPDYIACKILKSQQVRGFEWAENLLSQFEEAEHLFYRGWPYDSLELHFWRFEVKDSDEDIFYCFVHEIDFGPAEPDAFEKQYISQTEFYSKLKAFNENLSKNLFENFFKIPDSLTQNMASTLFSASERENLYTFFEKDEAESWRLGVVVERQNDRQLVTFSRFWN